MFFEQKGKFLAAEKFAFLPASPAAGSAIPPFASFTLVGGMWTTSRCYAFIFSTGEEDTSAPARVRSSP